MDDFNIKAGSGDIIKDKFKELEYIGEKVVREIMQDTMVSASTRLDSVKFVYDRSRGKPDQTVEYKGNLLQDLIKAINSAKAEGTKKLTKEEEEELFKISPTVN
jgi:hypothetical protein